ncbi:hypothetical protein DFJ77DRAFT_510992 [Powellomyces hirtus]|nr:hypothetical protein DFJ77DRAFT_510992 [Powellomyces hirtus]
MGREVSGSSSSISGGTDVSYCSSPRSLFRRAKSARVVLPDATTNEYEQQLDFIIAGRFNGAGLSKGLGVSGGDLLAVGGEDVAERTDMGLSGSRYDLCRRPPTAPASARRSSLDGPIPRQSKKEKPPTCRVKRDADASPTSDETARSRLMASAAEGDLPPRKFARSGAGAGSSPAAASNDQTSRAPGLSAMEDEDGPATVSEIVRLKAPPVRPLASLAQYDTFFDDISGWGEDDTLSVGHGGAAYQYLSIDGGDIDNLETSPSPGPDVVQRLKRLYIRKRPHRSAKVEGNKTAALSVEQKKSRLRKCVGYGEDEDEGMAGDADETEETTAASAESQAEKDERGEKKPFLEPLPGSSGNGIGAPKPSIPSKNRGTQSAALEHVSISSGALMVPRVPEKCRPVTAKQPPYKVPSTADHLSSSSAPSGPPSDNMAQMRKKLLSSARTNNRNLGIVQVPGDGPDPQGRGHTPLASLGSAVITGTKYCSQALGSSHNTPSLASVMSMNDKKPSRHWTSSGSISEPLTLPIPQQPTSNVSHPASSIPAIESSMTLLPIISSSCKHTPRSLTSAETQERSKPPPQLQHPPKGPPSLSRPGSSLPYSALSPLQQQSEGVPKWFAARAKNQMQQQHRSATLDRYSAALGATGTSMMAVPSHSPHERQVQTTNHVMRRPVKKLSQNGFQAVAFWDEEVVDFANISTVQGTPCTSSGPYVGPTIEIAVPVDNGADSNSILTPLGSRSFRDSISLNRTTTRACVT